jgi:hypothetical protein
VSPNSRWIFRACDNDGRVALFAAPLGCHRAPGTGAARPVRELPLVPQSITSGYTQYDWYTVSVTFGDPNNTQKQMDFYCNSSYSQNTVVLEITMSHLNCRYYAGGLPPPEGQGTYDTGCLDKGWT